MSDKQLLLNSHTKQQDNYSDGEEEETEIDEEYLTIYKPKYIMESYDSLT